MNLTSKARFRSSGNPLDSVSLLSVRTTNRSLPGRYSHLKRMLVLTLEALELYWFYVKEMKEFTRDESLHFISCTGRHGTIASCHRCVAHS